jgi:hypothetical protein
VRLRLGDPAAIARIREATYAGDNAEEVLRWMGGVTMPTVEAFDEEARVSWRAVRFAARLVSRLLLSILTVLALAGCGGSESGSDDGSGGSQITESEAVSPPPSTSPKSVTEPPPTGRVLAAGPAGSLEYRPTSLLLEVTGSIDNIRWRTYGGPTAVGVGVSSNGDRVTIRLRAIESCAGRLAYMQWSVGPRGGKQPDFDRILSAHRWIDVCDPEPE